MRTGIMHERERRWGSMISRSHSTGNGDAGRAPAEPFLRERISSAPLSPAPAHGHETYQRILDAIPAAVYMTDPAGRVTLFNASATELWGREPQPTIESWCGSWKIFTPDGAPMAIEDCPMARAIRDQKSVRGEEIVVERPDGTRRHVLPHPQPVFDSDGRVVAVCNMLVDITERRAMEQALRASEGRLRAILRQAAVGISLMDRDGRLLEVNDKLCQIVGRSAQELCAMTCEQLTHPDDWISNRAMIDEIALGQRREFVIEKRYLHRDGSWVWVNVGFTPLLDDAGQPRQMIAVVEDIGVRREFRERLEREVRERTQDLEVASSRLRERERLMALGTLSQGLGHDLANLILPLRAHLDALERSNGRTVASEEAESIRQGLDYLQRLSAGLRLMAVDPLVRSPAPGSTDPAAWWEESRGVLRAVLSHSVRLEARIAPGAPSALIDGATLLQAVFNLVQNAGEALEGRADGLVRVTIADQPASGDQPRMLRIEVQDNGPGMSPETAARCFEPFFSTKARSTCTGMGLPMVRSAVMNAGGLVSWAPVASGGGRFVILLPACDGRSAPAAPCRARVTLSSPRQAAVARVVLGALGAAECPDGADADVWVVEDPAPGDVRGFLSGAPGRCVVVWGQPAAGAPCAGHDHAGRVLHCGPSPDTRALRSCFELAMRIACEGAERPAGDAA